MIPDDNKDDERRVIILRPRRLAILAALFLHPTHGLLAAQFYSCWVPALICILLALGVASLGRGCRMVKEFTPRVENVVSSVGGDLVPISFGEGRIFFGGKVSYPYTRCEEGWQIDVAKFGEEAAVPAKKVAHQGLVLANSSVLYWLELEGNRTISRPLLNEKQMARLSNSMQNSGASQLDMEGLKSMVAMCMVLCVPVVACYVFLTMMLSMLITFLMFWIAMLLFRSETRKSKWTTFVLIMNCLMPPTLVASFWYCFVPLSFDFSHVFLLAALAYLLLIFFEARRKAEA
ncbi:MAG: hypothetical protein IJS08_17220 [Victivallales bacterium]|nr:hypothetical protein [Victivallales bacterium]